MKLRSEEGEMIVLVTHEGVETKVCGKLGVRLCVRGCRRLGHGWADGGVVQLDQEQAGGHASGVWARLHVSAHTPIRRKGCYYLAIRETDLQPEGWQFEFPVSPPQPATPHSKEEDSLHHPTWPTPPTKAKSAEGFSFEENRFDLYMMKMH